jgi:hypothetical protein
MVISNDRDLNIKYNFFGGEKAITDSFALEDLKEFGLNSYSSKMPYILKYDELNSLYALIWEPDQQGIAFRNKAELILSNNDITDPITVSRLRYVFTIFNKVSE